MVKQVKLSEIVKPNVAKVLVEDRKNNVVEIVSREDMNKKRVDLNNTTVVPYQKDLIDGAPIAEAYFVREFPLMQQFFQDRGIDPVVKYDFGTPGEYWMEIDFPLPSVGYFKKDGKVIKHKYPNTTEPLIIVLNGYPDFPPVGFFIEKRSPNLEIFQEVFKNHLLDRAYFVDDKVVEFFKDNWYWICFHYQDNSWSYDRYDITNGDNLTSYLYAIYYKLVGIEGVSHE